MDRLFYSPKDIHSKPSTFSQTIWNKIDIVIPGARNANPESRDSGSGPSDHRGMTEHYDSKIEGKNFPLYRYAHQGAGQGRAEAAGAGNREPRQILLSGRRAEDFGRRIR